MIIVDKIAEKTRQASMPAGVKWERGPRGIILARLWSS
jgi:hypothetical protein